MSLETPSASSWARFAPIANWLPRYQRAWMLTDVLAGLALWAVMVPEAIAYAGIVGVPAIMGLYTLVAPLVAYALFGGAASFHDRVTDGMHAFLGRDAP